MNKIYTFMFIVVAAVSCSYQDSVEPIIREIDQPQHLGYFIDPCNTTELINDITQGTGQVGVDADDCAFQSLLSGYWLGGCFYSATVDDIGIAGDRLNREPDFSVTYWELNSFGTYDAYVQDAWITRDC